MVHFPHGNAKNTYRVRQVSENGNAIRHTQREDLDEHLQVLTAIMTDLTVDVAKTLDYLAYSKEGSVPTRLLPLEQIITDLWEAASQLTKGLHFLF